jgi:choline dehydrogenase-like flavoprotein
VRVLGDSEKSSLQEFAARGKIVISGADATGLANSPNVVRLADSVGKTYGAEIEKDFEHASPDSQQAFFDSLQGGGAVRIKAGPLVATSIARTSDGHINCFFANFAGLKAGANPVQTPQEGVEVSVKTKSEKGSFLTFLGDVQAVKGVRHGDSVTFTLPTITKGAVFWYEE